MVPSNGRRPVVAGFITAIAVVVLANAGFACTQFKGKLTVQGLDALGNNSYGTSVNIGDNLSGAHGSCALPGGATNPTRDAKVKDFYTAGVLSTPVHLTTDRGLLDVTIGEASDCGPNNKLPRTHTNGSVLTYDINWINTAAYVNGTDVDKALGGNLITVGGSCMYYDGIVVVRLDNEVPMESTDDGTFAGANTRRVKISGSNPDPQSPVKGESALCLSNHQASGVARGFYGNQVPVTVI